MSTYQARWYKSEVQRELTRFGHMAEHEIINSFYINSRQLSNIVFPNGVLNGLGKLTNNLIINSLQTYSIKFYRLLRKLSTNKLSFIYCSFTNEYGIKSLCKILNAHGYCDYALYGAGRKRYALWTGSESASYKARIRNIYNSEDNDNASQIQLIIGSPAIKEGVSLMRVKQVHILELYWNHSRLAQIYGRASRFCSHKSLPKAERYCNIYLYCSYVYDNEASPDNSIDYLMLSIADQKRDEIEPYINEMISSAMDKLLLQ